MFDNFITVLNYDPLYIEIARAAVSRRSIIPVFSTLRFGDNALEEASREFFKHNTLPVDEVFVVGISPENVVFQHIDVPKVKNLKNLLRVANFKTATQFSLSPDEVVVKPLNNLKAINEGITPSFAITRQKYLGEFLDKLLKRGFPEPDIFTVKPFPVFNLVNRKIFEGFSFLFFVDLDYSVIIAMKFGEVVAINHITDGFNMLLPSISAEEKYTKEELKRKFLQFGDMLDQTFVEESSNTLKNMISYQLRIYITNTLSNSPNTVAADELSFKKFFVVGQSTLSTAIYRKTFESLLEETVVHELPFERRDLPISFSSLGMLKMGGEFLGNGKFTFKKAES
ncbi:MAG: hypothetical protein DRP32_00740 [Thermotogae bacterium]|uniref:Pilus assembly protein PilM n=1 Tax=Kosmotoga arenicorallina TaxID=688066 RepID=A0A7C5DV09_9BACT|nr:hypothetical protein [Kosmotoga sp.]MBO8166503.1 hypothetical protein [Kosmotoga sp.]RKX51103.1 MAG: hypothetical protein DRP32_00740 [Thermotogota bacterium]HHF08540.1 hypothetical protein [Kosmotoga arenicorallina]